MKLNSLENKLKIIVLLVMVFIYGCGETSLTNKTTTGPASNTLNNGWQYVKTFENEKAILTFKQFLAEISDKANFQNEKISALTGCGWAYIQAGARSEALELFEQARDTSSDANIGYAIALMMGKQTTQADRDKARYLLDKTNVNIYYDNNARNIFEIPSSYGLSQSELLGDDIHYLSTLEKAYIYSINCNKVRPADQADYYKKTAEEKAILNPNNVFPNDMIIEMVYTEQGERYTYQKILKYSGESTTAVLPVTDRR